MCVCTHRRAWFCLLFGLNFHSLPSDQAPGEGRAWNEAADVCSSEKLWEEPQWKAEAADVWHPNKGMCNTFSGFFFCSRILVSWEFYSPCSCWERWWPRKGQYLVNLFSAVHLSAGCHLHHRRVCRLRPSALCWSVHCKTEAFIWQIGQKHKTHKGSARALTSVLTKILPGWFLNDELINFQHANDAIGEISSLCG